MIDLTNPWTMTMLGLLEFSGAFFFTLLVGIAYAYNATYYFIGALVAGGVSMLLYFTCGMTYRPLFSVQMIIHRAIRREIGVLPSVGLAACVIGGSFAGAAFLSWIAAPFYDSILFHVKLGTTNNDIWIAFFIELLASIFFNLTPILTTKAHADITISAQMYGFSVGLVNLIAFVFTGAAFTLERYLAVSVFGDFDIAFARGFWIFLVVPPVGFMITLACDYLHDWMYEHALKWKPVEKIN